MLLDTVVIGSTVEAALYCLLKEATFVNTRSDPPMFYRTLPFSIMGAKAEPELWSRLCLMLSLLGQRLDSPASASIKVQQNEIVLTEDMLKRAYKFNNCVVFDSTGIDLETPIARPRQAKYLVLDDLELSGLGAKYTHLEEIERKPGFISRTNFYCSDRIDGANYITDCVVESHLTKEQLYEFDYSDTVVKFFVQKSLEDLGVHGRFMRFYNNGNPKYRKPTVKHVRRMVFEKDQNKYEDSGPIKFLNLSLKEIINEEST